MTLAATTVPPAVPTAPPSGTPASLEPGFPLGSRRVGPGEPAYFIADIGANHDGDLRRALDLIWQCAEAGADAAKFQNFKAETIVSAEGFAALGTRTGHQAAWDEPVVDVYRKAELPTDWTDELHAECARAGIDYLTTPYDLGMIPDLGRHVVAWKVGSGDITWDQMLEAVASDGKPVLLATGASEMSEVRRAVGVLRRYTGEIVLMQCNTNYSGDEGNFDHIALNVLTTYAEEFPDLVLGLSDHTPGCATAVGAIALGARVIEKHFTDDRTRKGPDHGFALDPPGWREMVERCRELERALGPRVKAVMDNERETVVVQRRALRTRRPLPAGAVLRPDDLVALRPCPPDGIAPYRLPEVAGGVLRVPLDAGALLRPSDLLR